MQRNFNCQRIKEPVTWIYRQEQSIELDTCTHPLSCRSEVFTESTVLEGYSLDIIGFTGTNSCIWLLSILFCQWLPSHDTCLAMPISWPWHMSWEEMNVQSPVVTFRSFSLGYPLSSHHHDNSVMHDNFWDTLLRSANNCETCFNLWSWKRLHNMRTSHPKDADVIEVLATDVLKTGWLLCFDEFQIENDSNTFIIHRYFHFHC